MKKLRRVVACILALVLTITGIMQILPEEETVYAAEITVSDTENTTVTELNLAINDAEDNSTIILQRDMEITESIVFGNGKSYTLDLNGHTITGKASMASLIQVSNGTTLTLKDSAAGSGDERFTYNIIEEEKVSSVKTETNRKEGTYQGGGLTVDNNVDGIQIDHIIDVQGSTFNMEGGAIYNNQSTYKNSDRVDYSVNGAGIYAVDSTINLHSGVIANNSTKYFGGGISVEHSNLNIKKSTEDPSRPSIIISGNTAVRRGGGVYVFNGIAVDDGAGNKYGRKANTAFQSVVVIDDPDCYITDNHVVSENLDYKDTGGGGFRLDDDTKFTLYNGKITGNTSNTSGGGIMAGYYNTNGWTDGNGYRWIPELDKVSVEIIGGYISANESFREGAGVFIGGNCSGKILGYDPDDESKSTETFITNNTVADNTQDWGGGGLFVGAASAEAKSYLEADGLFAYTGPGTMQVQKAIVTENTALGFGGGVAGCATARVFVNPDDIDQSGNVTGGSAEKILNNGVAIYGNDAKANHDGTYHPKIEEETDHLSGVTSAKSEDRIYTNGNKVFWESGFDDYFCALNSQIGNTMLGGGSENWVGSADSVYVKVEDITARDKNIYSSYLSGLTAQPTAEDIDKAVEKHTVTISGNSSGTHGGGILANGVLVLGAPPQNLEVQDRIIIDATKVVLNSDNTQVDHPATGFTFDVFQYDGQKIAEMKSVNGTVGDLLGEVTATFAYNGGSVREPWTEYTYFLVERGNEDIEYNADRSVYYIWLKGVRESEDAGDDMELDVAKIQQVRILKRTLTPDQFTYDENGEPKLEAAIATGIESDTLTDPDEKAANDKANDELWRNWQLEYMAFVDADGNFVETFHGTEDEMNKLQNGYWIETYLGDFDGDGKDDAYIITNGSETFKYSGSVSDLTNTQNPELHLAKISNNDTVTLALNYDTTDSSKNVFASGNDNTDNRIINLETGTDHAKLLHLDLALGDSAFVNTPNEVEDITVKKIWEDSDGIEMTAAPTVTFDLHAFVTKNGETTDEIIQSITLDGEIDDTEASAWTATFTGLKKTDVEGYPYTYQVKERDADTTDNIIDYTPVYVGGKDYADNGETITNTFNQEKVKVSVEKKWEDNDDREGQRPDQITVKLMQSVGSGTSTVIDTKEITAESNWTVTFEDLDKYDPATGEKYTYTIEEDAVTYYDATIAPEETADANTYKYVITNAFKQGNDNIQHAELSIFKVNTDNEPLSGAEFTLYDGEKELAVYSVEDGVAVIRTDDEKLKDVLPVAGNPKTLKLKETQEPFGYKIIDTEWEVVIKAEENGVNENGTYIKNITYSINVDGKDSLTVTNESIKTSVSGYKTWFDNGNKYKTRPKEVTVRLYADGQPTNYSAVVSAETDWKFEFKDIDKYNDTNEIEYTVKEDAVAGYTAEYEYKDGKWSVSNTYSIETTSVTVSKVWDDENNKDLIRPESVQVQLLADDVAVGEPVELNEANNWSYEWKDLDAWKEGATTEYITYKVEEVSAVAGYEKSVTDDGNNGFTITNKHVPGAIAVSITKEWADESNSDGCRPTANEFKGMVHLLNYGKEVTGYTADVTDHGDNTYTVSYANLPEYLDGKPASYSIREDLPKGYTSADTEAKNGETITNTFEPEVKVAHNQLSVSKVNRENEPLSGAEFTLYDGEKALAVYSVEDGVAVIRTDDEKLQTILPTVGTEKELTLKETKEPAGFIASEETWKVKISAEKSIAEKNNTYEKTITYTITVDGKDTLSVVNDNIKISVSGSKEWADENNRYNTRPAQITVRLYADNMPTDLTATVSEKTDWKYTFADLNMYTNSGRIIEYTVYEDDVLNVYETTYDDAHLNITNAYPIQHTSVTALKVWDDEENKDGIRPESIQVQLFADGVAVGEPVELNEANNWSYEWKEGATTEYITYKVEEVSAVAGYEQSVTDNGNNVFIIANKHVTGTIAVSITKQWEDGNDNDLLRPTAEEFQKMVHLMNDGKEVTGYTADVIDHGDNTYTVSYANLPEYLDGKPASYSIREDLPEGYVSDNTEAKDGEKITNKHELAVVDLKITKNWNDLDNMDSLRPSAEEFGSKIHLMNGDTEVEGYTPIVTDNGDNTYTISYEGLLKYQNGVEIEYSVIEDEILGYTSEIKGSVTEGFTITNTHIPEVDKPGTIVLIKTDESGNPLKGAEFSLYKEGLDRPIASGLVTDADGKITQTGLEAGVYYFRETKAVDGYLLPEGKEAETEHVLVNGNDQIAKYAEVTMINELEPTPELEEIPVPPTDLEAEMDTINDNNTAAADVDTSDRADMIQYVFLLFGGLIILAVAVLLIRKNRKMQ